MRLKVEVKYSKSSNEHKKIIIIIKSHNTNTAIKERTARASDRNWQLLNAYADGSAGTQTRGQDVFSNTRPTRAPARSCLWYNIFGRTITIVRTVRTSKYYFFLYFPFSIKFSTTDHDLFICTVNTYILGLRTTHIITTTLS